MQIYNPNISNNEMSSSDINNQDLYLNQLKALKPDNK